MPKSTYQLPEEWPLLSTYDQYRLGLLYPDPIPPLHPILAIEDLPRYCQSRLHAALRTGSIHPSTLRSHLADVALRSHGVLLVQHLCTPQLLSDIIDSSASLPTTSP